MSFRDQASGTIDFDAPDVHQLIEQIDVPRLPLTMAMRSNRDKLLYSEGWLFVDHPKGEHENVCLAPERSLLLGWLNDGTVDFVDFCFGEPRTKPAFLGRKYEPGTICGKRAFVALRLAASTLYPNHGQLVAPMRKLAHERWDELVADTAIVELKRRDRKEFLKSCAFLPYFQGWSDILVASAKRAK